MTLAQQAKCHPQVLKLEGDMLEIQLILWGSYTSIQLPLFIKRHMSVYMTYLSTLAYTVKDISSTSRQ